MTERREDEVSLAKCRLVQYLSRIPTRNVSQHDRDVQTLIESCGYPSTKEGAARTTLPTPMTPNQIIAEDVGSTKAAIILAALRERGWEVVLKEPEPQTVDWAAHWKELQRQAAIDPFRYT